MADGSSGLLAKFENIGGADLLALARVTETAERFEDMCEIMGALVKLKKENNQNLELEERNMLSVAYKNVVGSRRASWRTLKDEDQSQQYPVELKTKYKKLVEEELEMKCKEVLDLLEKNLVKEIDDNESFADENAVTAKYGDKAPAETQVFYLKMCGDYYRYLAEFSDNDEYKANAGKRYKQALSIAKAVLAPTHPTRLGLALNASVCYYEIMKQPQQACELAKAAFDEAIQKLDNLSDATYKDSTLIMQLLRDNLTIWTSEETGGVNGNQVEERED